MKPDFGLAGKVAVVTGAAGNLGPALVSALAQAGADVVGVDVTPNDADPGKAGPILHLEADVTDRASLEAARARITAELGPAQVLVNAAGIDQPPDAAASSYLLEEFPLAAFELTMSVNATGSFNAMQVFGSAMVGGGGGAIINIGSIYASLTPDPALYDHLEVTPPFLKPPAYGASKAAVVSLTRYFARVWGPHGVRVNALTPGGVRDRQDPEFVRKYVARVPVGRMAERPDLAGPLLFLASEASGYVTGQELRVDGGLSA